MNKNLLIAILSAGMVVCSSAEAFAQRGSLQNNSRATDTRGTSRSNSSSVSTPAAPSNATKDNHVAAPAKPDAPAKPAAPARPAAPAHHGNNNAVRNNPASGRPVLHPKGREAQTATNNKKLPPKKVRPSENYHKMERRGEVVSKRHATHNSQILRHNNHDYYYKKGVFYHYHNNQYVVSRPPIGVHVHAIPTPRIIVLHNVRYYYYYGAYYTMVGPNDYVVVQAPVGAVVESIPEGYEKLIIDGETYYIVDGVQYKAVVYDGEIWYEVIKILN